MPRVARPLVDAGIHSTQSDAGQGVRDAGLRDAGTFDAGVLLDAGVPDAGVIRDAGLFDAGAFDAGPVRDAGLFDGGAMVDAGVDAGACAALPTTSCAYSCEIEVATGIHNCIAPVTVLRSMTTPGKIMLDLQNRSSVDVELTTCNPRGWVFHLADSEGCNGYGGDDSRSNHDAEIQVLDSALTVFGSDVATPPSAVFNSTGTFVTAAGCSTRHVFVADQVIRSDNPCISVNNAGALRLNPPGELPGPADALWYVGMNGVVAGGRTGSGLTRLKFCIR